MKDKKPRRLLSHNPLDAGFLALKDSPVFNPFTRRTRIKTSCTPYICAIATFICQLYHGAQGEIKINK